MLVSTLHCITLIVCDLANLAVILDLPNRTIYASGALTVTERADAVRDVLAAAGVERCATTPCSCSEDTLMSS